MLKKNPPNHSWLREWNPWADMYHAFSLFGTCWWSCIFTSPACHTKSLIVYCSCSLWHSSNPGYYYNMQKKCSKSTVVRPSLELRTLNPHQSWEWSQMATFHQIHPFLKNMPFIHTTHSSTHSTAPLVFTTTLWTRVRWVWKTFAHVPVGGRAYQAQAA